MIYEVGSKAYIIESGRIVREVTIIRRSGNFYIIRFNDGRGGIQVRSTRLYATREEAEALLSKSFPYD